MIDFFNIPDNNLMRQVFYAKGSTDFQVWNKPANCKLVYIFCLGSGSGGGGGTPNLSNQAKKGGGGGGSGAYSTGIFSSINLPNTLYLRPGLGGAGGAGATNGGAGALSYVSVEPNTTALNILMQSGAVAATAGGGTGTGGTGSTIWTGSPLLNLGIAAAFAGVNGERGAISFPGADITITTLVSGGASGGNTSTTTPFIGGSILGTGFINTVTGGSPGASTFVPGTDGSDGYCANIVGTSSNSQPLFFTGGAGGGASQGGPGGTGGAGAYGSGGGGGGAGGSSQGGAGGRGGDGLIIITCF